MSDKSLVINPFDLLTQQQRTLVVTYLETGGDKTAAKKAAGLEYSGKDPFRAVNVRRAINHAMRPSFDKAGITFEKHLEYVANIAYGDPSEVAEIVKVNCRYCHGLNHEYQWTDMEFRDRLNKDIREFKAANAIKGVITQQELEDIHGFIPLSCEGGFGFDPWGEPDPMCPECGGEGVDKIRVHESATRHPLFAGVSYDKNSNMIVRFRNQDQALEHVSKLLGFLTEKVEVTVIDHAAKLNEARKRAAKKVSKKDGA